MFRIRSIETHVFRVPLARPVQTSFGKMHDRPAVLVKLTDADGTEGWGEVFCNWPAAGAEHRARLILEDMAFLILDRAFEAPGDLFKALTDETHVKVLQTGEVGPFAHAIAGLDLAAYDLCARAAGKPLAEYLLPGAPTSVPVYASGIQIDDAPTMIPAARDAGIRAFKVKVGFDTLADAEKVRAAYASLQPGELMMADANQAWDVAETVKFLTAIDGVPLTWLEEPIRVDFPDADWKALAEVSPVPLAGGENIAGFDDFDAAIRLGALGVIQPDAAKWGGVTGCLEVARRVTAAGKLYCPHFLGAGLGLLASAHILAASGSAGRLEVDVNPNPLRSEMLDGWPVFADGVVALPDGPGVGHPPILDTLAPYRTYLAERTA